MTELGGVRVDVDGLGGDLPVTVRDRHLEVVARTRSGTAVPVDAGIYVLEVPRPGQPPYRTAVTVESGRTVVRAIPVPLTGPDYAAGPAWSTELTQDADLPVPSAVPVGSRLLIDRVGAGPAFLSLRRVPRRSGGEVVPLRRRGADAGLWHVVLPPAATPVGVDAARRHVVPWARHLPLLEPAVVFAENGQVAEACDLLGQFAFRAETAEPLALLGLLALKINDDGILAEAAAAARRWAESSDLYAMAAAHADRTGDRSAPDLARAALASGCPVLSYGVTAVVSVLRGVPDSELGELAGRRHALTMLIRRAVMDRMLLTVYDADDTGADVLGTALGTALGLRRPVRRLMNSPPARVISLRFDRLGAAAAAPDHHRRSLEQRSETTEGVVVEFYAAAESSEMVVTVVVSDPAVVGAVVALTITDGDGPATAYLAAMTLDERGAAGRVVAPARSDAPLVTLTLPARPADALTAEDAPAVRRSMSGATADGIAFWLDLAEARGGTDPVAAAVLEGLR